MVISEALDYGQISGLSNEVREKLIRAKPGTLGQAARLEGMTPAAIALILAHIKKGVPGSTKTDKRAGSE